MTVKEPPPHNAETMDLQEFYEYMDKTRIEAVDELLKKYRTIPPLLGKVEEAVAGTNTGKAPQLAAYYQHWERAIFAALNRMVLSGMVEFNRLIIVRAKQAEADRVSRHVWQTNRKPELACKRPLLFLEYTEPLRVLNSDQAECEICACFPEP